jgi:hypothetical protein
MALRERPIYIVAGLLAAAALLLAAPGAFAQDPYKVEISGDRCQATIVAGQVYRLPAYEKEWVALKVQDYLFSNDRVKTLAKSRVQLSLPDGSMVRFDESTEFVISALKYDQAGKRRSVGMRLFLGKTWASVRRFLAQVGGFEVEMPQAVAGIRGTIFRANVYGDTSSLVRCYTGSIKVFKAPVRLPSPGEPGSAIQRVPGPHRVAGPRRVTMGEWIRIVEAMMQVTIGPDGVPGPPRSFTPQEDDNDWVRWNKELDRRAGF